MTTMPALPPLDNTMGALFVGTLISTALWGVSCLQAWTYYNTYQKDPFSLKLMVAAAMFCDTMHEILICHTTYIYLITNFANPLILGTVVWSIVWEVMFTGFTALLVQGFFCFRVYRLSQRNIPVTALTAALALGNFIAVLLYVGKAAHFTTFAEVATLKALSISVNALGAATDIVIAASLCFLLDNARTGFEQSDSMINRLMLFSVNTGLLTSICAIMSLIMIIALPNTFIYICFFFTLGRLYMNSLLANLNARHSIRDAKRTGASNSYHDSNNVSLGPMRTGSHNPLHSGGNTRVNEISIKIDTSKDYSRDAESDYKTSA